MTSISPGLIDVGLHFRADVLGVGQIKFSGFQALVAKPSLDVHQVHTVPQPAGRAGLSQAVEMVFLADRACGRMESITLRNLERPCGEFWTPVGR